MDCVVALYRGLKVAVYEVDKTELHLTRNDLVELVNVSLNTIVSTTSTLLFYSINGIHSFVRSFVLPSFHPSFIYSFIDLLFRSLFLFLSFFLSFFHARKS